MWSYGCRGTEAAEGRCRVPHTFLTAQCQGPCALCCSRVRCTPLFDLVEREFWRPGHLQMESTHGHPFTLFWKWWELLEDNNSTFLVLDSWNHPFDRQLHKQLLPAKGGSPPLCSSAALSSDPGFPSQGDGKPAPSGKQQTNQRPHFALKAQGPKHLPLSSKQWLHQLQISSFTSWQHDTHTVAVLSFKNNGSYSLPFDS